MTRIEKNMERKNILCDPSEKTYLNISALMKPDRLSYERLWPANSITCKYVVDPRFFCVLKMSLRCLKVSTLLLNSWITVKYGARQKLTRLTTQSQSLYIARFIRHVQFTAVLLFGNNSSTRSAFVKKLSEVNEKPMIIIIISVCSQIITYKAVKANSWLRYWLRT